MAVCAACCSECAGLKRQWGTGIVLVLVDIACVVLGRRWAVCSFQLLTETNCPSLCMYGERCHTPYACWVWGMLAVVCATVCCLCCVLLLQTAPGELCGGGGLFVAFVDT